MNRNLDIGWCSLITILLVLLSQYFYFERPVSRTARLYKSGAKGAVPAPKNKQKKGDLSNKKPNKTKSEGDVYKKQPYQKNSKASMNTDKVIQAIIDSSKYEEKFPIIKTNKPVDISSSLESNIRVFRERMLLKPKTFKIRIDADGLLDYTDKLFDGYCQPISLYVACNWDTISKNDNTVNTNEFVTWIINVMTNYSNIYEGFDNNFEEYFYFGYTDIFQLLASYCKIILVRLVGVKEEPNMSMFASGLKQCGIKHEHQKRSIIFMSTDKSPSVGHMRAYVPLTSQGSQPDSLTTDQQFQPPEIVKNTPENKNIEQSQNIKNLWIGEGTTAFQKFLKDFDIPQVQCGVSYRQNDIDYAWFFVVPAVVGDYTSKEEDITIENQHTSLDIQTLYFKMTMEQIHWDNFCPDERNISIQGAYFFSRKFAQELPLTRRILGPNLSVVRVQLSDYRYNFPRCGSVPSTDRVQLVSTFNCHACALLSKTIGHKRTKYQKYMGDQYEFNLLTFDGKIHDCSKMQDKYVIIKNEEAYMKQYLDKDKSDKPLQSMIGYIESGMSYYRYLFQDIGHNNSVKPLGLLERQRFCQLYYHQFILNIDNKTLYSDILDSKIKNMDRFPYIWRVGMRSIMAWLRRLLTILILLYIFYAIFCNKLGGLAVKAISDFKEEEAMFRKYWEELENLYKQHTSLVVYEEDYTLDKFAELMCYIMFMTFFGWTKLFITPDIAKIFVRLFISFFKILIFSENIVLNLVFMILYFYQVLILIFSMAILKMSDRDSLYYASFKLIASHVCVLLVLRFIFVRIYQILGLKNKLRILRKIFKDLLSIFLDLDWEEDTDPVAGAKEKHSFNFPKYNNKIAYTVSSLNNYQNQLIGNDVDVVHTEKTRFEQDLSKKGKSLVEASSDTCLQRDEKLWAKLMGICNCEHKNTLKQWKLTGQIAYENDVKIQNCTFSNCLSNLYYAVHARQGGSRSSPDPFVLKMFQQYSKKQIVIMNEKIKKKYPTFSFNLESFLQNLPAKKRALYLRGYNKALADHKIDGTMTAMVKQGEVHRVDNLGNASDRPRVIWNPSETVQLFVTAFNSVLIQMLKTQIPGFVHGLNKGDLQDKFNKEIPKDRVFLSCDTSGHDASQYSSLIQCCDNFFIEAHYDKIIDILRDEGNGLEIDHNMSKQLKKYILSLKTNYMMKYMNTIIERGTIKGTVFSGHATRTTFGNSLRVYMYISFALSFLDEIKGFYNIYVSGDDVLIACRQQDVEKIQEHLYKYVYLKKEGVGALGQVCKSIIYQKSSYSFLSCCGVVSSSGHSITRQPKRALLSGLNTRKNISVNDHYNSRVYQILSWCKDLIPFFSLTLRGVNNEEDLIKTMDFSWKMHLNKRPIDKYAVFQQWIIELGEQAYTFFDIDFNQPRFNLVAGCSHVLLSCVEQCDNT